MRVAAGQHSLAASSDLWRGGKNAALFLRRLVHEVAKEFASDKVPAHAGALAYFTVFSLPPLLVIALAIATAVFGEEAARGEVERQTRGLIGEQGARAIQTMIENARGPGSGRGFATWLGFLALVISSTSVFVQLQSALNEIWGVEAKKDRSRLWLIVRKRLLSFGMVAGMGFLLLVSLLVSAALAAFGDMMRSWYPDASFVNLMKVLDVVLSVGVITLLLAAVYVFLPDVKIPIHHVWLGAAVTATLFVLGKWLIGYYLGRSAPGTAYGAAGSLAIVLIWVYYSSMLMFVGAEFIQVYVRMRGARIVPEAHAMMVEKPDTTKLEFRKDSEGSEPPGPTARAVR